MITAGHLTAISGSYHGRGKAGLWLRFQPVNATHALNISAGVSWFNVFLGRSLKPPSISVLFGDCTENETWFVGGMHRGIWKDDNIRYTGALVKANVNMKFYGLDGGSGNLGDSPVKFNSSAVFFLQELQFRTSNSKWFTGLEYIYLNTDNTFDTSEVAPDSGLPNVEFSSSSAVL